MASRVALLTSLTVDDFLTVVSAQLGAEHPQQQKLSPYTFLKELDTDRKRLAKLFSQVGEEMQFPASEQNVLDLMHSMPHGNLSDMFLALRNQRIEREFKKKNKRWWYGSLVLAGLSAYLFVETYYFGAILIGYVFIGMREYLQGGQ